MARGSRVGADTATAACSTALNADGWGLKPRRRACTDREETVRDTHVGILLSVVASLPTSRACTSGNLLAICDAVWPSVGKLGKGLLATRLNTGTYDCMQYKAITLLRRGRQYYISHRRKWRYRPWA